MWVVWEPSNLEMSTLMVAVVQSHIEIMPTRIVRELNAIYKIN